jgi:hypothetical protein
MSEKGLRSAPPTFQYSQTPHNIQNVPDKHGKNVRACFMQKKKKMHVYKYGLPLLSCGIFEKGSIGIVQRLYPNFKAPSSRPSLLMLNPLKTKRICFI